MKIIHAIPSMAIRNGGPSFSTAECAFAVQQLGETTSIMTTDLSGPANMLSTVRGSTVADMPPECEALDVEVLPVRHPYRWAYSPDYRRAIQSATRSADLIHIHSLNLYPQYAAWRAAEDQNVPIVLTPHGALDRNTRSSGRFKKRVNNRLWQSSLFKSTTILHATSQDELDSIEESFSFPIRTVIPNGIYASRFAQSGNPLLFRSKYLGGFTGSLVMNHGRISRKKGLSVLVQAVAQISKTDIEIGLLLIGPDDEGLGEQLQRQAHELGISSRLFILGQLDHNELQNAFSAASVWCLPSEGENFGRAVTDAMSAGMPVITSPNVGISMDAHKNDAVEVVDTTPDILAYSIASILNNPSRSTRLGENARKYVRRFDWSVVGSQYISMYTECIKRFPTRG